MLYSGLSFEARKNRPFFYTNFVSTVDGKVQVLKNTKEYWPIGSSTDYQTLIELRTHADALIYGKNTAFSFNHAANLAKEEFKKKRQRIGKNPDIAYIILCNTTDNLVFENIAAHAVNTYIVTTEEAAVSEEVTNLVTLVRLGRNKVDINLLSQWLLGRGLRHVLVEGGPNVLGSFFALDLIDEIFLTISPKIFGNEKEQTLTLVEGHLFSPDTIKKLILLSVKQVKNELFLRYKVNHPNQEK